MAISCIIFNYIRPKGEPTNNRTESFNLRTPTVSGIEGTFSICKSSDFRLLLSANPVPQL